MKIFLDSANLDEIRCVTSLDDGRAPAARKAAR
jgi:hypothetical protein